MALFIYDKKGVKIAPVNPHKNMKLPNGDHLSGGSITEGWTHKEGYYAAIEVVEQPEVVVPTLIVSAFQALSVLDDMGLLDGLMAGTLPARLELFIKRAPEWREDQPNVLYILDKVGIAVEDRKNFWERAMGVM